MKSYRNAVAALVLALVLSTSAFAGVIQTDITGPNPQPTPTASSTTETAITDGVIQTGKAASTPEAPDTLTGIALNLLQSVFSLF